MIKGSTTKRSSRPQYIAATVYLLWTSSALGFIDTLVHTRWQGEPGTKITEAVNLLGIATSLLLVWWGTHKRRPRLNLAPPLLAVSVVVCSVLWSVDPGITLTRSIAYAFLVAGAIGLVKTIDANEVMELTASINGVLGAITLVLLVVLPNTVSLPDNFYGMFAQKNAQGQAMAIGILAGLHGLRIGRRKLRHIVIIVICAIVGVLSKSTTSLLTVLAFFALHIIGSLYIKGGGWRFISTSLTVIVTLVFILILENKDVLFSFLGKDSSLTGRTDLWPYVIDAIMRRPMFGWGFTAFWSGLNPRSMEISTLLGWYVVEAHNGLLQLLLDIGVVGTALFLFMWIRNLVMAVKCMNGSAPEIGVSSILLLVGILVIGVSEQVLTVVDSPTTQFFLLGFMCEQALREQALRSRVATISARARRRSAKTFPYRDPIHSYPDPIHSK
jgi:exopolysaccharide production protein ExoQ